MTLSGEHAEKLARLAERTYVQEAVLAQCLLATALDEAESDPRSVVEFLDGTPEAYERAQAGLDHARTGRTVPLSDL